MTEKTCETCRWSSYPTPYNHNDQPGAEPLGFKCQRRAPTATGGMMSAAWTMWPRVYAFDFCGEHTPKPTKDTDNG